MPESQRYVTQTIMAGVIYNGLQFESSNGVRLKRMEDKLVLIPDDTPRKAVDLEQFRRGDVYDLKELVYMTNAELGRY